MATLLGAAEVTAIVDVTRLVIDLAAKMYKPLRGETSLNDDINFIKDEFEMMGAHLLDASRGRGGQRNSSVARTWVRQARDLNYDVEDCFQELVILMEEPPRSPSTPQARKAVADKIKCLIERMQQSNQRYKLIKDSHAASAAHDTHSKFATMPNSFASKKALVGRETEKSHIIQIITKDDKSRQIIPIWGMGGLGKSALARSIYENQEIGDRFQKYAWINLSHPFNAEGFLRSLILQLQESDITVKEFIKKMQLKDLIEESYKLLQSMSYFIVLDNVSSIAEWRFLIQQIPEDENASRIIVTTREKSVAEHCSIDNIYKLEPLKDDDALELFKTKVLMETANFDSHPEMVEQAKRILCKCNGLPLAIATVGGLLVTRPKTAPEWVKFNEKFSFELEKNPSLEMIRTVLTSNCEDLPYHLQLCFLYLSIFPEDQNIRRRRLVRRWIAEGYSSGTRNMTAEENGESYFADLVSRSIIQPSESLGGAASINNCQVHNLLQEISISKSAEEMFSFVLHNRSNLHTKDAIRHLSITSCWKRVEDELKSIGDLSHLRSLTVCGEWQSFFISEKMTMLRVLDLEGTSGLRDHHIKNMITKLLHLKYLSLRGCGEIFWLPNALGNLWDLQTLDVRGTNIIILPATIVKLRKLQYLRAGRIPEDEQLSDRTGETDMKDEMQAALNTALRWTKTIVDLGATMVRPELLGNDVNRKDAFNTYCRNVCPGLAWGLDMHGVEVPSGVGNLNSLHTLGVVNFAAGKAILTELGNASQLHKLGVTGVNRENSKQFFSAISKLILLQSLSIRSEGKPGLQDCLDGHSSSPPIDIRSLKLYGNLVMLPTWISRLQNLAKLKLQSTRLGLDAMQVMGKLPHLTILRLLQNSFEGKDLQFHFKPGSFPALVFLQLDGLSDLQSVEFEEGATCMLELLQVKDCANIDNKDGCSGLSFLQSLKEVSLKADHGYDDKFMQQLRTQLARNSSLPALKEI